MLENHYIRQNKEECMLPNDQCQSKTLYRHDAKLQMFKKRPKHFWMSLNQLAGKQRSHEMAATKSKKSPLQNG
jgi:hypothetical protein